MRQQSVNNFKSYRFSNQWAALSIRPKWMPRSALLRKQQMTRSLTHPKNELKRSVNDFWHCVMTYPVGCAVTVRHNQTIGHLSIGQWWWQHFYYVLKWASTERQRFLALHLRNCMGCEATLRQNRAIGRHSRQNLLQQHRYYVVKMSVNGASTTLGLVSWKILVLCSNIRP